MVINRVELVITMRDNNDSWLQSKCTCPVFMKEYICKHIIGLAHAKKLVNVPLSAKNVLLGKGRSRGRPAFALACLQRQPLDSILDSDENLEDPELLEICQVATSEVVETVEEVAANNLIFGLDDIIVTTNVSTEPLDIDALIRDFLTPENSNSGAEASALTQVMEPGQEIRSIQLDDGVVKKKRKERCDKGRPREKKQKN